jgi:hypothetical protein
MHRQLRDMQHSRTTLIAVVVGLIFCCFSACVKPVQPPAPSGAYALSVLQLQDDFMQIKWPQCNVKDFEKYELFYVINDTTDVTYVSIADAQLLYTSNKSTDTAMLDSAFRVADKGYYKLRVHLKGRYLESKFHEVNPGHTFNYAFLDIKPIRKANLAVAHVASGISGSKYITFDYRTNQILGESQEFANSNRFAISIGQQQHKVVVQSAASELKVFDATSYNTLGTINSPYGLPIVAVSSNDKFVLLNCIRADSVVYYSYSVNTFLLLDSVVMPNDHLSIVAASSDNIYSIGFNNFARFRINEVSGKLSRINITYSSVSGLSNIKLIVYDYGGGCLAPISRLAIMDTLKYGVASTFSINSNSAIATDSIGEYTCLLDGFTNTILRLGDKPPYSFTSILPGLAPLPQINATNKVGFIAGGRLYVFGRNFFYQGSSSRNSGTFAYNRALLRDF